MKFRPLPPIERWGIGTLVFLMIAFQEMTPRSFRVTFLGFKTGKRQEEDLHLTGKEKDFTIASFLKYSSKKMEVRGL